MKGLLVAGGEGTRMFPMTSVYSKQLILIYDKPMIYYPLSLFLTMRIKEVLLICTEHDLPLFQRLLGDGSDLGLSLSYSVQKQPKGIAHALVLAEEFLDGDSVCLVLGDNVFYGPRLSSILRSHTNLEKGAVVFGYPVEHPERYGVLEFDAQNRVTRLVEKPLHPTSSYAVPGLYFYDNQVVEISKGLSPSARGEYEITHVNQVYLERGLLDVELLTHDILWLDTGTPEDLLKAHNFVADTERLYGMKIGCLEETAFEEGYLTSEAFNNLIQKMPKSEYKNYLQNRLDTHLRISV